jgi:hypothetical protein
MSNIENKNNALFGLIFLCICVMLLATSYRAGEYCGRKTGRCSVVCDNTSNVAVCESGITVCKTGEVQWRKQGQY